MKAQTFILTALFVLSSASFLPENFNSAGVISNHSKSEQTVNSFENQYTYVRVLQDGVWYIYVYDGGKLIAVYPE